MGAREELTRSATGGEEGSIRAHWVRGHWKGVWQGSGETRVKMPRWIRPYRKGNAGPSGDSARVYEVKDKNSTP